MTGGLVMVDNRWHSKKVGTYQPADYRVSVRLDWPSLGFLRSPPDDSLRQLVIWPSVTVSGVLYSHSFHFFKVL